MIRKGMLLKGHDLEGVVAELGHLGKDVPAEVLEGGDLLFLGAQTDMALINEGMGALPGALVLPDVGSAGSQTWAQKTLVSGS